MFFFFFLKSIKMYSYCHYLHIVNHRNIVRSPVLMRELWLQMLHDIHPNAKSSFVTKGESHLPLFTGHFLRICETDNFSQLSVDLWGTRIVTGTMEKLVVPGLSTVNTGKPLLWRKLIFHMFINSLSFTSFMALQICFWGRSPWTEL